MGLETATYIADLVATNPIGPTDPKSQGDDHLRLLKSVLQNTFPGAGKAFDFSTLWPTQTVRGLYIRTHPDADSAASKIMLIHADEIVLDDGTRVAPANGLVGDLAVSGAGGRMTGYTEGASEWIEANYIRKSSDGTEGLILRAAKKWSQDQAQTSDDGNAATFFTTSNNAKIAQSFQLATAGEVPFVITKQAKVASPTGNMWLTIEADSSGAPSGTPLATSDKIDVSKLATSAQEILFPFRSPASLSASTTYWLVWNSDLTPDGVNYVDTRYKAITNPYANGKLIDFDSSAWQTGFGGDGGVSDVYFKIFVTISATTWAYPTGYNQRCLLGYFYNNSGSNLVRTVAHNRRIKLLEDSAAGNTAATIPTLFDLSALLPPVPLRVFQDAGNSTGSARANAAGIPEGFGAAINSGAEGSVQVIVPAASANEQVPMNPILTEFQRAYYFTSAGTAYFWISGWEW